MVASMSPAAWCAACAVLLGACIEPDYGLEPFLCARTSRCPEGYRCVDGVCQSSPGTIPDGPGAPDHLRPDGLDAGPLDLDATVDHPPASDLPDAAPQDTTSPDQLKPDAWQPPGTWKALNKGSFQMGSPSSEPCRDTGDETQHKVTFTRGFWIMTTEVTQTMFKSIMGYLPASLTSCASCPVARVTWHEAAAYCNALSKKAGLKACYSCSGTKASASCSSAYAGAKIYTCPGYRLPTEAEWEYACRAGTTTAFQSGAISGASCSTCASKDANADKIGWYCANSGNAAHPVGQKTANKWGLFDMAGNVVEWCHDPYTSSLGSTAVQDPVGTAGAETNARGGSYWSWARYLRSANRNSFPPADSSQYVGLRPVRTRP
jgi:formylglycine-generating enzyme required for sulfatase activity